MRINTIVNYINLHNAKIAQFLEPVNNTLPIVQEANNKASKIATEILEPVNNIVKEHIINRRRNL